MCSVEVINLYVTNVIYLYGNYGFLWSHQFEKILVFNRSEVFFLFSSSTSIVQTNNSDT